MKERERGRCWGLWNREKVIGLGDEFLLES